MTVKNGVTSSLQFGVNNQTDVFFIDTNGQLHVAWVNSGGPWNGPIGLGPAGVFPPGAGVVASNQFGVSNQTDVFAIGANGQLQVAWVNGGGAWNGPIGLGPAGVFPPGAGVVASNQFGVNNQTDVFAVGANGQLHVAWVNGGGAWNGPIGIGPAGVFPPGAGVGASNQFGVNNQTDVFAIGANGQLQVAWVNGGGAWNGPIGIGPAGVFPPGAGVVASNQFGVNNQTDVFAIGANGQLHVAWVNSGGAWNGPIGIGPAGVFPPGAGVGASNQFGVNNQTDVFAIGANGQLHVAWVNGGGAWNGPIGIGPTGVFPPGAGVVASNQFGVGNQTDVFAIGNDGLLHVAWVNGGDAWNGPIALTRPPQIVIASLQDDHGRFVKVDGTNFTPNGSVLIDFQITAGGAPTTTTSGELSATANASQAFTARIDVNLVGVSAAAVKATDRATNRSATASL
jgi:hypothetical protein